MSMWMWHRFYLLFLAILVLPLASDCNVVCYGHGDHNAFDCNVVCYGHGDHNASSNHEANIRVFATILPNKISSSCCLNGTDSSSCRACITLALQEARTVCLYHKDVELSNGNYSLKLSRIIYLGSPDFLLPKNDGYKEGFSMKRNLSVAKENIMTLVFQAIGFAWLFFLLQQDWHDRKRRSMMLVSHKTSHNI